MSILIEGMQAKLVLPVMSFTIALNHRPTYTLQ
jgi:hypothetical protein